MVGQSRQRESVTNAGLPAGLDSETVRKVYERWAPLYDLVWGALLSPGRKAGVEAAKAVGGRVLEIGIGTGLSLEDYKGAPVELYGIDVSAEMLAKAEARARSLRSSQLRQLQVMDAHELAFGDRFFDSVVAQYVITVVERPEQVLSECARVVRPGGEVIIVSRFSSERGVGGHLDRMLAGPLRRIGLRSEFHFGPLERWAASDGRLQLIEHRKVGLFGDALVRFRRV